MKFNMEWSVLFRNVKLEFEMEFLRWNTVFKGPMKLFYFELTEIRSKDRTKNLKT